MIGGEQASQVPIWPHFLVPVLEVLADGQPRKRREILAAAQDRLGLSDSARAETVSLGEGRADNRAGWAISHMFKAGWLERPVRATYVISERGKVWLAQNPNAQPSFSDANQLFKDFWPGSTTTSGVESLAGGVASSAEEVETSPEEQIQGGIDLVHATVADDLLNRLRTADPTFFEEAVVKLLLAMGYGGAEQRGMRIGGTGDGGVDGVIDQDPLGLDQIYVQAKRYAAGNNIGRETIQAFIGALAGRVATRGVFITTSDFTSNARSYTQSISTNIVLINAKRLTDLMVKYKVGVQVTRTYELVDVDEDFFE